MTVNPRIVFFGTPEVAAETLEYLIQAGLNIVAVVSKPDKPIGRSNTPQPTPVKKIALQYNLPLMQPEKVSSPEPSEQLSTFHADLFVIVAYGEIIKQHLLDMPSLGCINEHLSLLPKYRGAAPVQHAILQAETETGVTIMYLVKQMDAGDIIATVKVPISQEITHGELLQELCRVGKKLLLDTIHALAEGRASRTPQDHSQATMAPKVELENCEVIWSNDALSIHNLIRSSNPEPGAWCYVLVKNEKKRLRLFQSKVHEISGGEPGKILSWGDQGLIVSCGKNAIEILQLQLEGKKSMPSKDLMRGIALTNFQFC